MISKRLCRSVKTSCCGIDLAALARESRVTSAGGLPTFLADLLQLYFSIVSWSWRHIKFSLAAFLVSLYDHLYIQRSTRRSLPWDPFVGLSAALESPFRVLSHCTVSLSLSTLTLYDFPAKDAVDFFFFEKVGR